MQYTGAKGLFLALFLKRGALAVVTTILVAVSFAAGKVSSAQTTSPRREGVLYGLFIGIDKYKDLRIPPLEYAGADAKAMHDLLRQRTPYSLGEFVLLTNDEATRQRILEALKRMSNAGEDDTVLVYIASHGATEEEIGKRDNAFLIPYDAVPGNLKQTGLSLEDLPKFLDPIWAKRIFLIIDACYSGNSIGRTFSFGPQRRSAPNLNEVMRLMTETKGRAVLSASRPDEVSIELHNLKHGAFTYFLMEGMKGHADQDGNRLITMNELYSYVRQKVLALSTELKVPQHPLLQASLDGDPVLTLAAMPRKDDEQAFRHLIEQAKLSFQATRVVVLADGQAQIEMYVSGQLFGSWKEPKREVLIPRRLFAKGETSVEIKLVAKNERGGVEKRFKLHQGQDIGVFVEAPKRSTTPVEPVLVPMAP
jgi:uncharacterized caspase-like protein